MICIYISIYILHVTYCILHIANTYTYTYTYAYTYTCTSRSTSTSTSTCTCTCTYTYTYTHTIHIHIHIHITYSYPYAYTHTYTYTYTYTYANAYTYPYTYTYTYGVPFGPLLIFPSKLRRFVQFVLGSSPRAAQETCQREGSGHGGKVGTQAPKSQNPGCMWQFHVCSFSQSGSEMGVGRVKLESGGKGESEREQRREKREERTQRGEERKREVERCKGGRVIR